MEPPAAAAAPESPEGSGAPRRRRCLGALLASLPPHCWGQAAELAALAGPVRRQFHILRNVGKVELDAVTLAVSMGSVTGIAIGTGLASACDTLMSQSYGGKNLKRVGTILQRGILILPGSIQATFLFQLQTRYLQSQGIILPQVITGIVMNIINVGMNALLLYALDLGVVGSAWANTTSQLFLCALLFLHVWWRKIYVHTWGGLWYGLIVCVFFQALFYSVYIWKINCNRVAEQAQVRAGLKGIKETMPVPTDLPILEKDVTDGVALPDIIRPESQSFQLMESNSLSSN
ncbi:Multidrug and toxin extrusion protein 1 [Manis javanica]|nr:Multidrug and toxin extrusion protein 1 [Manis javanica]